MVQVAPVLGLAESLRPAAAAMAAATGLAIDLVESAATLPPANVFIDALGYGIGMELGTRYDPLIDPIYVYPDPRRSPPRTDRGYCIWMGFPHDVALRCADFTLLTKRFRARGGDALRFWSEAVIFAPDEWAHVDGFLAADHRHNAIYFAQCFVPLREPDPVRRYLGLECLLRALGLAQGTAFAEPSALATRITPMYPEIREGDPYPGIYAVTEGPWRGGPATPPMPTGYDLRLLGALY